MPSNYNKIKQDNILRYGTEIARIGPMLLADRYDDRTHFIYELLQNAEDALKRRGPRKGARSVAFQLGKAGLRVSHFGQPFNEDDVRGICGIGESTKPKDLTAIGRFGIGFKAVYAFTDAPEIHSGDEHFCVESYVWPRSTPPLSAKTDETIFDFPFKDKDSVAHEEIASGFRRLGVRTLLFLREIDEITWEIKGGASGTYMRDKPELFAPNAQRIALIGQEAGSTGVTEETWLVFSRDVKTKAGKDAGCVQVAFALHKDESRRRWVVKRVADSTLVVFFPTIVPTNLGFLVQGPYRTTPSRDNIPRDDAWNRHLVHQTAELLTEALVTLRDKNLLNIDVLLSLPLDREKFGESAMFAPLFDSVRAALMSDALLPKFGGGYVSSKQARLARGKDLRELFDSDQLTSLSLARKELSWLTEEITQDRTQELRQYLMKELEVTEIDPASLVPRLTKSFLERQSDKWIVRLYDFLLGQPAITRLGALRDKPLVRLESGAHVAAWQGTSPQVFLPAKTTSEFPTVRREIASNPSAREFLKHLGLTEPDPVDEVIKFVLPKYAGDAIEVSDDDYAKDIDLLLRAFKTDSKSQRDRLIAATRTVWVVMAVKADDGATCACLPGQVYFPSQRLRDLFDGVPNVFFVDDGYDCLKGEDVREMLEACGSSRYLQPISVDNAFDWKQRAEMRRQAGAATSTGGDRVEDWTLRGLSELLAQLPTLPSEPASKKAALLWEALSDVENRRGSGVFSGTYRWYYYHERSCSFEAAFVRTLNEQPWVPDPNGKLKTPDCVVFQSLTPSWKDNPFLLSRIRFKPPIIEALAKEVGLEPGLLDLLKQLGMTEAELRMRLGIPDVASRTGDGGNAGGLSAEDALKKLLGDQNQPSPGIPEEPPSDDGRQQRGDGNRNGDGGGSGSGGDGGDIKPAGSGGQGSGTKRKDDSTASVTGGAPPFISYVGVHASDDDPDPDGLDHEERMGLEAAAIELIVRLEPRLNRTDANNPGFDLYENGISGQPARWVEVKAMTGTLGDRPVCISRTQFETARERGAAYWLYVVESARLSDQARIVKIQDPAGKARSFTFDQGWIEIAKVGTLAKGN